MLRYGELLQEMNFKELIDQMNFKELLDLAKKACQFFVGEDFWMPSQKKNGGGGVFHKPL